MEFWAYLLGLFVIFFGVGVWAKGLKPMIIIVVWMIIGGGPGLVVMEHNEFIGTILLVAWLLASHLVVVRVRKRQIEERESRRIE